jgi:hypothetical protein
VLVRKKSAGRLSQDTVLAAGAVALTAVFLLIEVITAAASSPYTLQPLEKSLLTIVALFSLFLLFTVFQISRKRLKTAQILALVQALMLFLIALLMFFFAGSVFRTFKSARCFVPGMVAFIDILLAFLIPFS